MIELKQHLKETVTKLTRIAAGVAAATAAIASGTTPPSPVPGATPANVAKGEQQKRDIEDAIKIDEADLIKIQAQILTLETEKLKLDGDLPILQTEYKKISTDVKNKETAIPAKELEVAQVKQNIIENKEALQTLKIKILLKDTQTLLTWLIRTGILYNKMQLNQTKIILLVLKV